MPAADSEVPESEAPEASKEFDDAEESDDSSRTRSSLPHAESPKKRKRNPETQDSGSSKLSDPGNASPPPLDLFNMAL